MSKQYVIWNNVMNAYRIGDHHYARSIFGAKKYNTFTEAHKEMGEDEEIMTYDKAVKTSTTRKTPTTNPNDLAFPVACPSGDIYGGLTKREYFAAMALQGILANPQRFESICYEESDEAVAFADCLIKTLNEKAES